MSALSSFRMGIARSMGFQTRVTGMRAFNAFGMPVTIPVKRRLRSWSIIDWQMEPGQQAEGTKPGRRWLHRAMRRASTPAQKREIENHFIKLHKKGAR